MSKIIETMIRRAKRVKFLKKAYQSAIQPYVQSHISEITPFTPRESENTSRRINLLVPSINQIHLFGGISTAIQFYNQVLDHFNETKRRIITTDAAPEERDLIGFSEYKVTNPDQDPDLDFQLVPFNDRYNKTLPVGPHDIFIVTSWWTAYFAQRIVQWQSDFYNKEPNKIIYFIQDYEPGFYAWSSQYALADSTYRYSGPQVAVFNSSLLRDYFVNQGYTFKQSYCFEPRLNKSLKSKLIENNETENKKKILIYGRPSVSRNAFPLIMEALRVWVWKCPNASEWEVISAGEQHEDIGIGNGVIIKSKGKMTLDEYAEELKTSSIGISLMISPHPSYPPLEMAHFGMNVITNNYANKDLSNYHSNIVSLDDISPENIAATLTSLCAQFPNKPSSREISHFTSLYLGNTTQFEFLDELVRGFK